MIANIRDFSDKKFFSYIKNTRPFDNHLDKFDSKGNYKKLNNSTLTLVILRTLNKDQWNSFINYLYNLYDIKTTSECEYNNFEEKLIKCQKEFCLTSASVRYKLEAALHAIGE